MAPSSITIVEIGACTWVSNDEEIARKNRPSSIRRSFFRVGPIALELLPSARWFFIHAHFMYDKIVTPICRYPTVADVASNRNIQYYPPFLKPPRSLWLPAFHDRCAINVPNQSSTLL